MQILIEEELLDKPQITEKDVHRLIVESKTVKRCPSCGCLIIIDDQQCKIQYFEEKIAKI